MRNALINELTKLAKANHNIHVILPDIGVFAFKQAGFPEKQLINVGICEANMINVAGGLAVTKKIPVCYTIAPFATSRCFEQIKMACYNKLPIKIVGVGAGLTYSHEGPTHHALDDITIMSSLPNMYVYSPCSGEEAALITQEIVNNCKPSYIRLTTKPDGPYDWSLQCKYIEKRVDGYGTTIIAPVISKQTEYMPFMFIKYSVCAKVAIITTGGIIGSVLQAVENDDRFSVYSMSQLNPVHLGGAGPDLISVLKNHNSIITIEEHSQQGLGDIINNIMCRSKIKTDLYRKGTPNDFCPIFGTREEVLDWAGLTVKNIKEYIDCIAKS